MTATDATTRVVSESGNDIGPGQRLREAREAANLTLAEVASRMRLEPGVLELLEDDHYERLHGATFVRGYLSGYARLLDLPERPILEAYERHGYGPPALVSELGRKPEVHVSDFPVRMVTYVIAGLLVVLVVLWWQSRQPPIGGADFALPGADAPQAASQPASSSETADAAVPSAESTESADSPQTTKTAAVAATTEDSAETVQTTSGSPREIPTETPSESPSESARVVEEQPAPPVATNEQTTSNEAAYVEVPPDNNQAIAATAETQTASQDVNPTAGDETSGESQSPGASPLEALESSGGAEADATTASAETEESAPRPAPLPGSDRLAIQLARESWVEIYDRGGGRLYYSLAQEGSEVVVQGAGPMRVLLGDVEGAAVAYNGEAFDLSPYQGRSVVRFTIGEVSSTTAPEAPAPTEAQEPLTLEIPMAEFAPVAHASPGLSSPAAAPGPSRQEPPGNGTVASETANDPGPPDS